MFSHRRVHEAPRLFFIFFFKPGFFYGFPNEYRPTKNSYEN